MASPLEGALESFLPESYRIQASPGEAQVSADRRPFGPYVWLIWPLHAKAQYCSPLGSQSPWMLRRLCIMQWL